MNTFHCCATCEHFRSERVDDKMRYYCSRLRYETHPKYQFNCWSPTEIVQKLMEKRKQER
ncbi:hypothetical protein D1953_18630 [Peribacillus asahii]|uniref:Uncharacterized protein n=1 Tax=Peribacillus asahii TaxID=228899 RepID=A0A398AWZ8_9BACI|nr:hypothetical protein [Peribacillus asahii]RID82172.1 hypothetical protein D1953_18630 [Peribacillus asahii]